MSNPDQSETAAGQAAATVEAKEEAAFSDDENAQGCPTAKARPKAGAKGKAKSKSKAKEKDLKTEMKKKTPVTTCICPGCPWPKYAGSRFCSEGDHKKAWDNMVYQRRSRKDISDSDKKNFDDYMKDDGVAGKAVLEFSRDNPPEMKRKGLVDFTRLSGRRPAQEKFP